MDWVRLVLEYVRVLTWPITTIVLFLSFKKQIVEMANRLKHADLPGGVSIDLQEAVNQTQKLSDRLQLVQQPEEHKKGPYIPLTEANTRMISLGLRPSPSGLDISYYRTLAEQDPNLALAGLRIEIDVLAKNLAEGFQIQSKTGKTGAQLLRMLYDNNAISSDQKQLAMEILSVCNLAVHGTRISLEEALTIIDSAKVLTDQYLSWLSWGFPDGWQPPATKTV